MSFCCFGQIWLQSVFSSIKSNVFFSAAICYRQSSLFKIWTELTLVTTSRSFIISRHQIHKLKIWNHQFCSIPPFLTTSVDKPCGRNNCMIWLHQLQHNMSSFFFPLHVKMRVAGNLAGGTREVQSGRSHRRYRRLLGISDKINPQTCWWIIQISAQWCMRTERPRAWRKPEFGCGGEKTQKSEAANWQGTMEKVISSCEKLVKQPFCVIRFATCKGTALVSFLFFSFENEGGGRPAELYETSACLLCRDWFH